MLHGCGLGRWGCCSNLAAGFECTTGCTSGPVEDRAGPHRRLVVGTCVGASSLWQGDRACMWRQFLRFKVVSQSWLLGQSYGQTLGVVQG
jgi:hypothetical protein